MNRSDFLRTSSQFACASCVSLMLGSRAAAAEAAPGPDPAATAKALDAERATNAFINHWLTDLFAAIETELSPADQLKLMQACGRGCYRRHQFKQDLAAAGQGDADQLIEAYKKNFGVVRDGDLVHIRYADHCFCPAARNRPSSGPHDLHCECTRFTHETIFSTALGRPIRVELVESVRRGGQTCHLIAHLS